MDLEVVRFVADHRLEPLTLLMSVASAWWFKSVLLVGIGLVADLRTPRRLPVAAVSAAVAYGVAHVLVQVAKEAADRPRPSLQDPSIVVEGSLPGSAAMPSGHAATAFAVATVIALLHPWLRWWVLGLAGLVAVSRVYLAVHFPTDVLVGAALGAAVGWTAVHAAPPAVIRRAGPPGGRLRPARRRG